MKDKFIRNYVIAALLFYVFMCWLLLSGCYTESKAVKQVAKAGWQYPTVISDYCGSKYPVKTVTEYKQGETITRHDTVSVDCDTVKGIVNVVTNTIERKVYVPCPPCEIRVDTFYKESENTASIEKQRREISDLRSEKAVADNNAAFWKKWAIWASIAALLMIIWKILNWTSVFKL